MSSIRYTSSPALRRCLDQSDDDSFDVALFSDGLLAQLLGQFAAEFESKHEPHVIGHCGALGPPRNSQPRCRSEFEDAEEALLLLRCRERKLGLTMPPVLTAFRC